MPKKEELLEKTIITIKREGEIKKMPENEFFIIILDCNKKSEVNSIQFLQNKQKLFN